MIVLAVGTPIDYWGGATRAVIMDRNISQIHGHFEQSNRDWDCDWMSHLPDNWLIIVRVAATAYFVGRLTNWWSCDRVHVHLNGSILFWLHATSVHRRRYYLFTANLDWLPGQVNRRIIIILLLYMVQLATRISVAHNTFDDECVYIF